MIREWILVLYGTMFPPQKNDTIPMQTAVKKKVGDMKFNKKQKNTTQEPGEKDSKRKLNKVKKNNQKMSTSSTPFMTFEMSSGEDFEKENYNKKKTETTLQVTVTTPRPRVTVKMPLLKSQDNGNNMYTKKANLKGSTYAGNKVSGKLPKQANNNNLFSTESTIIPKKFENYAKIEQFYPELRPIKEYNDPMFFTVTNGRKLDHENSKSWSSMPTNNNSPSSSRREDEDNESSRPKQQLKKMSKGR
jgi:hypothetical protein